MIGLIKMICHSFPRDDDRLKIRYCSRISTRHRKQTRNSHTMTTIIFAILFLLCLISWSIDLPSSILQANIKTSDSKRVTGGHLLHHLFLYKCDIYILKCIFSTVYRWIKIETILSVHWFIHSSQTGAVY